MNNGKQTLRKYLSDEEAGVNISWSAIFAGLVTFFAIIITLSLVGTAIGLGNLNLTSENPGAGVGTGLLIWSVISVLISFICAGFVSGVAAKRLGVLHGFLTWATSLLITAVILSFTAIGALSTVGSLVGSVTSGIGHGTGFVLSKTSDATSAIFDKITSGVNNNIDTNELQGNIKKYLKDTDVKELQPDYLNNQLDEAVDDVKDSAKEIAKNPRDTDKIFKSTVESLKARTKNITESVDKEAIAKSVSKNSDLSKEEAKEITDNIYNELNSAKDKANKELDSITDKLENAKEDIDKSVEKAKVEADKAAKETSKVSIYGFIAMILSIIVTSLFGSIGSNIVKK